MQLLYVLIAALAYRGLLTFGSEADLTRELEEWFFIPTETSPLVVVLLAAWLVYRRGPRLAALQDRPPSWGVALPLLLVGTVVFAWSTLTTTPHLLAISLLFVGLGIVAIHFGAGGLRFTVLPSVLLLFAVPMPAPLLSEIVFTFQLWTADYAGWLLFAIGRTAYVSGDQILLAGDHFAVIEGCSGLRSVQTLTMVAVLLVELFGRRGLHAWVIVGLAPFVAFALNGFRVLALILNPHSEVVAIHNLQGVAILLGGLVVLYVVDGLFERFRPDAGLEPLPEPVDAGPVDRTRVAVAGAFLVVLVALSFVLSPWPMAGRAGQPGPDDIALEQGPWKGDFRPIDLAFLGSTGKDRIYDIQYRQPGGGVPGGADDRRRQHGVALPEPHLPEDGAARYRLAHRGERRARAPGQLPGAPGT